MSGPVLGAKNTQKTVPAFKELMTVQWKKQIDSRQLLCCGISALIEETRDTLRAHLGMAVKEGFPENMKPRRALGISQVKRMGRGATWITHLVFSRDSAQPSFSIKRSYFLL